MNWFTSWASSQSGASLLVALIALVGVLATTWWNNRAADKRRRQDQKDEYDRRKEDVELRVNERKESLWREDLARQRTAVINCIRTIKDAEIQFQKSAISKAYEDPKTLASDRFSQMLLEVNKATLFGDFFHTSMLAAEELELEVTQPQVRAWVTRLSERIQNEYNEFVTQNALGAEAWLKWTSERPAISVTVQTYMNGLAASAFEHLHPYPTPDGATVVYGDGSAGMSDVPNATRPGTRDHAEAERKKTDNDK